jgi:hypothetical protein
MEENRNFLGVLVEQLAVTLAMDYFTEEVLVVQMVELVELVQRELL